MATLLGKEHFIWRGVGRVEAEQFLPFFSVALICRSFFFFFFLDNCTRIFIAEHLAREARASGAP